MSPLPKRRFVRTPTPVFKRAVAVGAAALVSVSLLGTVSALPARADSPCSDGSSPALLATVTCSDAGNYTLTVPDGTSSVDLDAVGAGGGAGYPARAHLGGNAAEVTGTLTLPAGTAYLYVVVGTAGTGDNHGTSTGGGGSAVFAEDSGHALLAKLAIAGGGGGGAYNGDGGNAGSPGNSDNAQIVSGPGQPGVGPTGGAGGTGNYANGGAGGTDNPTTLTIAAGGAGGQVPGGAYGGGGAGGYGGGGGGGGSTNGVLNRNIAGGGGGSSLASAYLGSASIAIAPDTGGVQLPGLVASDGATGTVTLTFDGLAVPGSPTGASATPGHNQASVSFTAPASDGGSPITSYTVTSSPGGLTATCPGSPCVITGLTDGTSYTFTVHATNANGDSAESAASTTVTPADNPGAPSDVVATGSNASASVSWTAPTNDGGAAITGYTVTSSPGGLTATCSTSPCVVDGLTNGTSYTFTVVATNTIGDSAASPASSPTAVRTVPDAPSITAVSHGNAAATVSFTAPTDNGGATISGYTLIASPGGASASCSASPCSITGLTNGETYTLRLVATNAAGNSDPSSATDPITPATVPNAPTTLRVVRGDGEADLSFEAPDGDGGSSITGYQVSTDGGHTWADLSVSGSAPYTATVTGLSNGNAYSIAVRAVNGEGHGASTEASNVTPAGHPGSPTGVTGVRGNRQVSVSWTTPSDNGAAISSYLVLVPELDRTVSCPASPCVIDGLTNGTEYHFRVRAANTVGSSDFSALSAGYTPATAAGAPNLVSLSSGDRTLVATFSPTRTANNGGDPVTGYEYSINGGSWHTVASTAISDSDNRLATITGLTNGTADTVRIRAVNGTGGGIASNGRTETPATRPGLPRSVTVVTAHGKVVVSWTPPASDGGSPITGYLVVAQPGGEVCLASGVSRRSCTFTDLTPGATYRFAVGAVNTADKRTGTGLSGPAVSAPTKITDVPAAPTGLSVKLGDRAVALVFSKPTSTGGKPISGYEVSTDGGKTWHPLATTAVGGSSTRLSAGIAGLADGATYTIEIRVRNANGTSPATPAITAHLSAWFKDPISKANRAKEVKVPTNPTSYQGKLVNTTATNRSHNGTVAVNATSLKGRQLQAEQAVQLGGNSLFAFNSPKLTADGVKLVKSMAVSLKYVDAITCEGYADYGGSKKNESSLAKARATTVCATIHTYAEQVGSRTVVGYGASRPVVIGSTPSKRAENRRVVVLIRR